jgi:hypothetical protein
MIFLMNQLMVTVSWLKAYRKLMIAQIDFKVYKKNKPQNYRSVKHIFRELIGCEANYVSILESGMKNYVSAMDDPDLPIELREQKLNIFSNIYRIYDLHASLFCPALQSSAGDITKISEIFINYIKNGYFYCYVVFMQNREKTLQLCDEHKLFFQVRAWRYLSLSE